MSDHIIPVDEIFGIEGFGWLGRADQLAILDMPANLGLLERSLNASKRANPLGDWITGRAPQSPRLSPSQQQALIGRQAAARAAVEEEIARRLARMREQ